MGCDAAARCSTILPAIHHRRTSTVGRLTGSIALTRNLRTSTGLASPVYQSRGLNFRTPELPRVKNEDTEGNPESESLVFDEQKLLRDLNIAIKDENYGWAAKLRDDLRTLQENSKALVLSANSRFYNAFRNGDLAAMQSIWAKHDDVCCVHPGAGRISGYELVMGSWEIVCGADQEFPINIDLKNVEVHVRGDIGYVTCMEVVKTKGSSWGKQVATNVFERIDGQWFMCIHHASHIEA